MSFRNEPNLDDPAEAWAHKVMEALKQIEPDENDQFPVFVVVIETPPDGRIGLASIGDDLVDTHRMLALAAAATRRSMSEEERRRARALWLSMRAGFESRN